MLLFGGIILQIIIMSYNASMAWSRGQLKYTIDKGYISSKYYNIIANIQMRGASQKRSNWC